MHLDSSLIGKDGDWSWVGDPSRDAGQGACLYGRVQGLGFVALWAGDIAIRRRTSPGCSR